MTLSGLSAVLVVALACQLGITVPSCEDCNLNRLYHFTLWHWRGIMLGTWSQDETLYINREWFDWTNNFPGRKTWFLYQIFLEKYNRLPLFHFKSNWKSSCFETTLFGKVIGKSLPVPADPWLWQNDPSWEESRRNILLLLANTISNFLRSKLFEVRKKRLSKGLLEVEMIFILQRLIEAKEVWC